LKPGDLLRSRDKRWVAVEAVGRAGKRRKVYNLKVDNANCFIGGEGQGFSVLVYGACKKEAAFTARRVLPKIER